MLLHEVVPEFFVNNF